MKISDKFEAVLQVRSFELKKIEEHLPDFLKLGRKYIPMASDGCCPTLAQIHGIFPIDFSRLLYICGRSEFKWSITKPFRENILQMEELQSQFELQRKDHLGNLVNDYWGTMNPENLFVLGTLIDSFNGIRDLNHLKGLFLGTGYGFPEKMAVDILGEHEIDTVDFRSDEDESREEVEVVYDLDGRNITYGPSQLAYVKSLPQKIGQFLPECATFHHSDSYRFLSGKSGQLYDYIVIDGNHLFEAVKSDLDLAFPLLKDGGFLFLDDYGGNKMATNPGVSVAAFYYAYENDLTGYWVSSPNDPFQTNSAFFIK